VVGGRKCVCFKRVFLKLGGADQESTSYLVHALVLCVALPLALTYMHSFGGDVMAVGFKFAVGLLYAPFVRGWYKDADM
jgi:hypothetical protein